MLDQAGRSSRKISTAFNAELVPGCYVTKPRRPVETPAGAGPASLAIAAGANVKVLQTLLGHKTATLDAGPLRAFVP
jgi:hypothetical protein